MGKVCVCVAGNALKKKKRDTGDIRPPSSDPTVAPLPKPTMHTDQHTAQVSDNVAGAYAQASRGMGGSKR